MTPRKGTIDPNNLGTDPVTRLYHRVLLRLGVKREITWWLFDSLRWATLLWFAMIFGAGLAMGRLASRDATIATGLSLVLGALLGHVFWAGRIVTGRKRPPRHKARRRQPP